MNARLTREELTVQLYGGEDYRVYAGKRLIATVYSEDDLRWLIDRDAALREEIEQVKKERDNFKQMIGDVSKGLDPVKVLTEGMAHVIAIKQQLTQAQVENASLREALGQCLEDYMRWRYASPTLIDIAQAALASREGT